MSEDQFYQHIQETLPKNIDQQTLNNFFVALTGWRMGLTLTYFTSTKFKLSNTDKEVSSHHLFENKKENIPDSISLETIMIDNELKNHHLSIQTIDEATTGVRFYKFFFEKNKIISATLIDESTITGDGKSSILELIDLKINQNTFLKNKKNNEMVFANTIPANSKVLNLITYQTVSNAEPIYQVLEAIIKMVAFEQTGEWTVTIHDENKTISLSSSLTNPDFHCHIAANSKKGLQVASAVLNAFFDSNTSDYVTNNFMFDYKRIVAIFSNGYTKSLVVSPCNLGAFTYAEIIMYGELNTNKFRRWIQQRVLFYQLDGKLHYTNNNNVILNVLGSKDNIERLYKLLDKNCPIRSFNYVEENNTLIKTGFEFTPIGLKR